MFFLTKSSCTTVLIVPITFFTISRILSQSGAFLQEQKKMLARTRNLKRFFLQNSFIRKFEISGNKNHSSNLFTFSSALFFSHVCTYAVDCSQYVVHLVADVVVLGVVGDPWVAGDEGVLRTDVQRVVDLPVDVTDFAGWVKQAL